jgi:MoaA/NifB/PqqE/SkfB family radical SAM enzyme
MRRGFNISWHGPAAAAGSELTKKLILPPLYHALMAKTATRKFLGTFFHNRVSSRKHPFFGSVECTRRCNSRCTFCPIGNERPEFKEGEMDTGQFCRILDQFSEFDIIAVSFLGGEPTLRKDLVELGSYCDKVGLVSQISTNGITLADNADAYTGAFDVIVVSLDTLDPQRYKEIRGVDKYDRVVDGIKSAVKAGKRNKCAVLINTVICADNIGEVTGVVRYAKELGTDGIMLDFATFHDYWTTITTEGSRYDPKRMDWRNKVDEVKRLVPELMEMRRKYPILTSKSYLKTFMTGNFKYRCHPYLFCCVNKLGEIAVPCYDSSITKFYSLLDGQRRLKDFWFSPEVRAARRKVKDCTTCYMHCIVEPSKVLGEPLRNLGDLAGWVGTFQKHGRV